MNYQDFASFVPDYGIDLIVNKYVRKRSEGYTYFSVILKIDKFLLILLI